MTTEAPAVITPEMRQALWQRVERARRANHRDGGGHSTVFIFENELAALLDALDQAEQRIAKLDRAVVCAWGAHYADDGPDGQPLTLEQRRELSQEFYELALVTEAGDGE